MTKSKMLPIERLFGVPPALAVDLYEFGPDRHDHVWIKVRRPKPGVLVVDLRGVREAQRLQDLPQRAIRASGEPTFAEIAIHGFGNLVLHAPSVTASHGLYDRLFGPAEGARRHRPCKPLHLRLVRRENAAMPSPISINLARYDFLSVRIAVAAAQQGSLSAAAASCYLALAAASRRLRELEASLGAPLFERHRRGLIL